MERNLALEEPKQRAEAPAEGEARAPMSKEAFEAKCTADMGALMAEVRSGSLAAEFVRIATWHLAEVAHSYGNRVTADILRQFAGHLGYLQERDIALHEAVAAKLAGRRPQ